MSSQEKLPLCLFRSQWNRKLFKLMFLRNQENQRLLEHKKQGLNVYVLFYRSTIELKQN